MSCLAYNNKIYYNYKPNYRLEVIIITKKKDWK